LDETSQLARYRPRMVPRDQESAADGSSVAEPKKFGLIAHDVVGQRIRDKRLPAKESQDIYVGLVAWPDGSGVRTGPRKEMEFRLILVNESDTVRLCISTCRIVQ
jgi:hypothetical protein